MKKSLLLALIFITVICMLTLSACSTEGIPIVEELTILGSPETEYRRGSEVDLRGSQLRARLSDGNEILVPIDESMIIVSDMNIIGTQTVIITYRDAKVSFAINIIDAPVISIALNTEPAKKNYIEGEDLNLNGGYINVNYDIGQPSIIPIAANMISDYNKNEIGEQTVKVSYEGHSVSFKVNVRARALSEMRIEQSISDTLYTEDDTISLEGGKLRLIYDNGTHEIVLMDTLQDLGVSYDLVSAVGGKATVTLTYKDKQVAFAVNVVENLITSYILYRDTVILDTLPAQKVNTALNLTDIDIELRYSDGDKERISLEDQNLVTITGYDKSIVGTQLLLLTFYNDLTLEDLQITIRERSPETLEIFEPTDDEGNTPIYYQDSPIDILGWTYTVTYDNGYKLENQPLSIEMIEGGQPSLNNTQTAGEIALTIIFMDTQTGGYLEMEYAIEITALSITSSAIGIQVNEDEVIPVESARVVYVNHDLNLQGLKLIIEYNSGKTQQIQLLSQYISNFDKNQLGEQTVNVKYTNKYGTIEDSFAVKVIRKAVSLSLFKDPTKLLYIKGETFDPTGMEMYIEYEDELTPILVTEFGSEWQGIDTVFDVIDFDEVQNKYNPIALQLTYTNSEMDENQVSITLSMEVKNDLEYIELAKKIGNDIVPIDVEEPFTTVLEGLKIDTLGFYVIMHFENGESENIALIYETHIFDFNYTDTTLGNRELTVKVTKHGKIAALGAFVEVLERSIIGIEIEGTSIYQTEYDADPDNELIIEGIFIRILYDNDTEKKINWHDEGLAFSGFLVGVPGVQVITITYLNEFTTTYQINVAEPEVVELEWKNNQTPHLYITQGQEISFPSDLEILVTTQFGETYYLYIVDILDEIDIIDFDSGSATPQQPRIVYKGKELAFLLDVGSRELVSIEFAQGSSIPDVKEGMNLDLNNARIIAYYDNNTQKEVFIRQSYTDYNKDNLTTGPRTITISYTHNEVTKQLATTINVLPKKLANIELITMPKIYYIEKELFTLLTLEGASGKIRVNYDNETYEERLLTEATIGDPTKAFNIDISAFDNEEFSGTNQAQRIVINYTIGTTTCSTEYNISMNDRLYAKVIFEPSNVYSFYYGSVTDPVFSLMGYPEYDKSLEERTSVLSGYETKYINNDTEEESYELPTDVGTYTVEISFAGDDIHNALLDTTKTITIFPKKIFVYAENAQKIYGEENPEISIKYLNPDDGKEETAFAYGQDASAFGDTLEITYKTSAGAILPQIEKKTAVGAYSIILGGLQSHNYTISYTYEGYSVGIMTISRRSVQVVADPQEEEYGKANIVLTYISSGLVEGDTLYGGLMRPSNNNVGTYHITQGDLTNTNNPNYNITFVSNDVIIYAKHIYVAADSYQRAYGDNNPTLTVKYYAEPAPVGGGIRNSNAFVYSDTPASLGTLDIQTAATAASPIGDYIITLGGLQSDNYIIHYETARIIVARRPIEVEAYFEAPEDGIKIYGENDPAEFKYRINPIEGNPSSGLIQGDSLTGDMTRSTMGGGLQNDPVGDYEIRQGSLANNNYNIVNFVSATFTIIKRDATLEISAGKLTKIYNGLAPSITSNDFTVYNGYNINNDNINIVFVAGSRNVGAYLASIVNDDTNHNITFYNPEGYTFTITQKEVRIQFKQRDGSEYIELQDELVFNDTAYNFAAYIHPEDIVAPDQVQVALNLYTATEVGNYTITATSLDSSNYKLPTPAPSLALRINKRELTLFLKEADEQTNEIRVQYTNSPAQVNKYLACIKDADDNILYDNGNYPTISFSFNIYVINPSGSPTPPRDVRFNENDEIIGYEIGATLTEEFFARNNMLELAYDYSYIIEKADANIIIASTSGTITKPYDTLEPHITSVNTGGTTITINDLEFTFTRDIAEGDPTDYSGWSNADVGTYKISVDFKPYAENKNYNLGLAQDYYYEITKVRAFARLSGAASKSYDGADAQLVASNFNFTNYQGNVTNNIASGRLIIDIEWDDSNGARINVGSYDYTVECNDRNHNIDTLIGAYAVNARLVTFNNISGSKTYGQPDPVITYAVTAGSLAPNETLEGVIKRVAGENAGSYNFSIEDLEEKNTNYVFSYMHTWHFTIYHKPINIFIKDTLGGDNINATYGEFTNINNYTTFVIDPTGLAAGDTIADVGLLEYPQSLTSSEVIKESNAGNYAISATVRLDMMSNYEAIVDDTAIFTVLRAPIQLVFNYNGRFEIKYGLSQNDLEFSYTGYKFEGDSLDYEPDYSVINGSALQGSSVGTIFNVVLSHTGGGQNLNYYFNFSESHQCQIEIIRTPLSIKLKPIQGTIINTIYGEEPGYTFEFNGFVLGEGPGHPNYVAPDFDWLLNAGSYLGTGGVIPSVNTMTGFYSNYLVTYLTCDYTVQKRNLYVAIDTMVAAFAKDGEAAYSQNWLSLTNQGTSLIPETGKVYLIVSEGAYYRKTYTWTGSAYQESTLPPTYIKMHVLSGVELERYKTDSESRVFTGNYSFDVDPVLTVQEQAIYGTVPYGLTGGDTIENLFINIYTDYFMLSWKFNEKSVKSTELYTSRIIYPTIGNYILTNYTFVGLEREAIVHTYLTSFEIVQDELLIDDTADGSVIWVRGYRQDNQQMLLNINDPGFTYSNYAQSGEYRNQTLAQITYSEPYIGVGDYTVIGAPSISNITINNQTIRIYSTQEQDFSAYQLKNQANQSYTMGSEISSGAEYRLKNASNQLITENYDKVYLSARFSDLVVGNYFRLILSGQGATTLAVEITEKGMMLIEPGIADYFFAHTDFLTDGFIHDMLFILNKRDGGLTVSIDGVDYIFHSIAKSKFNDVSIAGFDVVGMSAWIKDYRVVRQGYPSKLGLSITNAENDLVYVTDSGQDDISLNVNELFNFNSIKNLVAGTAYSVIYKINDTVHPELLLYINPNTGQPVMSEELQLVPGYYDIVCTVYNDFIDYEVLAEFSTRITVRSRQSYYDAWLQGGTEYPDMNTINKAFGHTYSGNELVATTNTQTSTITLANGISEQYNKLSMVFELDRASYQGQYRTIKQYYILGLEDTYNFAIISLKSNHNNYNAYTALTNDSDFIGLAIAIGYDAVSDKPTTRLYLHANGTSVFKFVSAIRTDIDWLAGKVRLDATFDEDNDVINILVYTNYLTSAQELTVIRIDTYTTMFNVSSSSNGTISRSIINEITSLTPKKTYPQVANIAFELYESRIILHRLIAGEHKVDSARHDYVEIKDTGCEYVARNAQLSALGTTKLIAFNDGFNGAYLYEYDTYRIDIQGLSLQEGGAVEFIIASNDAPNLLAPGATNRNRVLKLVYSEGQLKFIFDHHGYLSYAQSIDIGGINLADGNEHTIIVNNPRESINFSDLLITANNPVIANRVNIIVDGREGVKGYYPNANDSRNWVYQESFDRIVSSQRFIGRLTWAGIRLTDASVQEINMLVGEGIV